MKTATLSVLSALAALVVSCAMSALDGALEKGSALSAGGTGGVANACGPAGEVGNGGAGGVYGVDPFPLCAKAVASGGRAFAIACSASSDANVYLRSASKWQIYSGINVAHIAASGTGVPWALRSDGRIYWHPGGSFQQVPGCAISIGVGATATDAWVVGCDAGSTGAILRFDGTQFNQVRAGSFRAIAVGSDNIPWAVDQSNDSYRWNGSAFVATAGPCAGAIGGGGWAAGCDGTSIWHFDSGAWARQATLAIPATTISNDGLFLSNTNGAVLLKKCGI